MTRPNVSVLLPTYNRAKFIAESLKSVFAQTLPPSQVIVINDGSTDHTTAALEPFKRRIEYLETENRGKPSALNLGMAQVTGEYVWIMDDDDVAMSDAVERHVAILESRPELGWTYSSYVESLTSEENARIAPQKEKALPNFPKEEFLIRLMEESFLIHPTILVRTSCYRQSGPFRAELVRCQDYEMSVRLARKFACERVAGPTIYHRLHREPRGSAGDTFSVDQIYEKWLEYMQLFFRELHREMPLSEYLPEGHVSGGKALDLRYAYLRRMGIMARKRLYDEMIEDLRLAQESSDQARVLSTAEEQLLRETFNFINDPLFFKKDLLRRIRSVCPGSLGFAIRRELIRCLYWSAVGAGRRRNVSGVAISASAAMQLAGIGVLRLFFRDRKSNRTAMNSDSHD
ncbi:MAG TPA: glycosyltransferase family 2 protein [Candidatus Acidoferrum sp.]